MRRRGRSLLGFLRLLSQVSQTTPPRAAPAALALTPPLATWVPGLSAHETELTGKRRNSLPNPTWHRAGTWRGLGRRGLNDPTCYSREGKGRVARLPWVSSWASPHPGSEKHPRAPGAGEAEAPAQGGWTGHPDLTDETAVEEATQTDAIGCQRRQQTRRAKEQGTT